MCDSLDIGSFLSGKGRHKIRSIYILSVKNKISFLSLRDMSVKLLNNPTDFETLFRYNFRPLCLYALHYLGDADSSEDVVQDCFMKLWERLEQGIDVSNTRAYLYMTVRNRCLDLLRRKGVPTESLKPYDTYGIIDDDDAQERSQTEARLWTAIDSLPEKCREVFIMSKRDGLKYEEIAEELGLSVNTVRNQISKALKVLKEGIHKVYMFFFA